MSDDFDMFELGEDDDPLGDGDLLEMALEDAEETEIGDGEVKYLADGRAVLVIEPLGDDRLLVQEFSPYDDNGEASGPLSIVPRVFNQAPTTRYDKKIESLRKEIDELAAKRETIRREIWQSEEGSRERLARWQKNKALAVADLFLTGGIHYFFVGSYDPKIVTFEEAVAKTEASWSGRKNVIDLIYENREFHWESGNHEVIPCATLEDAKARAQEWIDRLLKDSSRSPDSRVIALAQVHGLRLDPAYIERHKEYNRKQYQRRIDEKEAEIAELRKSLEAIG